MENSRLWRIKEKHLSRGRNRLSRNEKDNLQKSRYHFILNYFRNSILYIIFRGQVFFYMNSNLESWFSQNIYSGSDTFL